MSARKHAFLILAHSNPQFVARLVNSLVAPNHYFFIHIDKKSKEDFSCLKQIPNCTFLKKRVSCNWGGFSLVEATLNLLKEAKAADNFSYFHLLSGTDYFCSTNEAFDKFWAGEVVLFTKRYALKKALAKVEKFGFSWFIPVVAKYKNFLFII